jgi:aspartate kinase
LIVLKFGGTSVESAERILAAAEIVRDCRDRSPVVVVSALAGVTGLLDEAIRAALRDDREAIERNLADLERRHRWALAGGVETSSRRHDLSLEADGLFDDLRSRLRSMRILGEGTARGADALLAFGEILSSKLVAGVFEDRGLAASWVDSRDVVSTDASFGSAEPNLEATGARAGATLRPLIEAGRVPVLGGFIGRAPDGETTTLGRGGSDTSAAVLGHVLAAEEIQVWTDVNGLMTADPRRVPAARTLPCVSYGEAAELAFYGARVLHPASIAPAVQKAIPLRVLNSGRPAGQGTIVHGEGDSGEGRPLAAVASREGVALVRLTSRRMRMDPGFLPEVLREFARAGVIAELLVSSEVAVSAVVAADAELEELERRLAPSARLDVATDRAIICVVGRGLAGGSDCRASVLAALAEWRPELVALGASETSASAIVRSSDLESALRALHRRFFEEVGQS